MKQTTHNTKRRTLIKGAAWTAPLIATVSLPSHAETSAPQIPLEFFAADSAMASAQRQTPWYANALNHTIAKANAQSDNMVGLCVTVDSDANTAEVKIFLPTYTATGTLALDGTQADLPITDSGFGCLSPIELSDCSIVDYTLGDTEIRVDTDGGKGTLIASEGTCEEVMLISCSVPDV